LLSLSIALAALDVAGRWRAGRWPAPPDDDPADPLARLRVLNIADTVA
jgi:hypothetical protein